jgi:hypothetical protein
MGPPKPDGVPERWRDAAVAWWPASANNMSIRA